jgi:hypothetical protein
MERTKTRPKRLAPSGRAQTCQVSLTPAQADWLASRGCPASAYLRQLVEREIWHEAEAAQRNEGTPVGPLVMVA